MTPDPLLNQALTDINPNIFRKNKSISDTDLRSILKHCPSLTTLDLSGFHQISEEALLCIATLQQLTTLNLSETKVVDLGPLCRNPLSKLQTLNLLKTDIPPASLFDFLQRHTITNLLPPANPPKGFFGRFQSDSLQEIMLHIDRCDPESLPFHEITRFVKNARSLKKLWVRINAKTEFNVSEVSGPLCTRDFIIESQNLQALFKLPAGNVS
ncbi:MAG: hypothetical protein LLG04_11715 [Parachlamydia sp.]|nr:hypothetical protein [Parachlamydia sp.]